MVDMQITKWKYPAQAFFFVESRHTASAPSTAGTHTGGVQK